ncbi:hypothetical protein FNV43_RR14660 [Rhamnella rubrinervis]|uniref:Chromo domain-containing protein n=1 Tax=Rhamnella rubrinervis TaxID=2594499 RepID=A0A8K0MGI9_9ROSA|nr:hypothetical protein FNV43_RR14660 [Rhamnella rubrinervis]
MAFSMPRGDALPSTPHTIVANYKRRSLSTFKVVKNGVEQVDLASSNLQKRKSKRKSRDTTNTYDKERLVHGRSNHPSHEYIVRWKGRPEGEASLEPMTALWQFKDHIKGFHTRNYVVFYVGGDISSMDLIVDKNVGFAQDIDIHRIDRNATIASLTEMDAAFLPPLFS